MKTLLQKVLLMAVFLLSIYALSAQQIPELIPYRSGKLWGYVNPKMVLKIPCTYSTVYLFQNDLAVVKDDSKPGSQYKYINKKGEVQLGPYYSAGNFYNGLAIVGVSKNYKTYNGLIDFKGKEVIPIKYPYLYWTYNNEYLVAEDDNGNHFIYDRSGKILFESHESSVQYINNKMAILRKPATENNPDQFALVNLDGSFRIPFSNKAFYEVEENHLCYSEYSEKNKRDESGVMDWNGKIIIDPSAYITGEYKKYKGVTQYFSYLYTIKDGLCVVQKNLNGKQNAFGAVDTSGNLIIPIEYQELRNFTNGFSLAKKDNKYGIINKKNEVVVPFAYDTVNSIHEGKAIFVKKGKYGCISVNGTELFPAIYDMAYDYNNGYAVVIKNNKMGFVDKNGKLSIECKYDEAFDFENGYAMVGLADKYGYIDTTGKVIIPLKYELEPKIKYDPYGYGDDRSLYQEKGIYPYISFSEDNQKGYPINNGLLKLTCGYVDVFGNEYFDDGKVLKAKSTKDYKNICDAIYARDSVAIEIFIENGAALNVKYTYKTESKFSNYDEYPLESIMHFYDNEDLYYYLKLFIDNGLNINRPAETNKLTPYLFKIITYVENDKNKFEIMKLLLDKGADINITDYHKDNALHYMMNENYRDDNIDLDMVRFLIANGIDLSYKNGVGYTPLKLASYGKNKELIDLLKKSKKKK
jgi:hypothetical protein